MTERSEGQWRWPLPDDWDPEGFWCVQITIPANQQYFDRLTGALGMLTLSKAWFPDPTGAGPKAVAAAWENALYLNMFSIQENCIVVPTPPIPDAAAAADAAAAVFNVFFRYIINQLNTCAPTPGDCTTCVDDLMTTLTAYGANEAVRGALSRLCADLNELTTEQRDAFDAECPYEPQFDDLSVEIEDNPYDWLNHLSDWLFAWLDSTSSAIFNDLNTVGGLLGGMGIGGFIEDNGGIPSGGGTGFGGDCTWEHDFWPTGEEGWFGASGFGTFVTDHWESVNTSGFTEVCAVRVNITETTITRIEIAGSASEIANGGSRGIYINGSLAEALSDGSGSITGTWIGEMAATQIQVEIDINSPASPQSSQIDTVHMEGIGTDPFV